MIKRAIAKGVRNPVKLVDMLNVGVKSITLDETLSIRQLEDLGLKFRGFNPDNLKTYGLPVVFSNHNGADTVDLIEAQAAPILRVFQGVSAATVSPITVKVKVQNGSGQTDQGRTVTAALARAGFQTDVPSDAPLAAQTTVYYAAGRQAAAQQVARYLRAPALLQQTPFATDVTIITGSDFFGVLGTPKPASAIPTTTTPPAPGAPTASTAPVSIPPTTVQGVVPPPPPADISCG